ncbi:MULTISPECIES: response regulator [unclassified Rhizobium]|jgi:CheY-like chemotaxis protein|uniref:response regulator n=1 Tax=unclassified Rhizobium TaxID=2613769 RepID=UPI000828BC05|nr:MULTISPECIES: response regulator [unclassified Rhizobium]OCJ08190.1 transcriptional regulator [Rhizobium sp. AC27/96]TIX93345.1 response regulator [Rhizobium sp. P44RR-XXIV]TXH80882.1 MAG: response regulator [Rhizobium sp.]
MPTEPVVVLVVEDEPLLRLSISAELEDEGFVVLEAGSADDAIRIIEQHPEVSLVFTDVDMPGMMDGIRLAGFVRDRWPPIKIIVTSGHRFPGAETLPKGSPFMPKPYISDEVVTMIRTMLAV